MMTDDAKKARDLRRHLRDLTAAVAAHLEAIDREMQGPSSFDRGSRIAALCNRLELANDMARRFGLGVRLSKIKPPRGGGASKRAGPPAGGPALVVGRRSATRRA
jgi:hypothetical protein